MLTRDTATGSADNEVLYTSQQVDQYDEHHIHCTAGAVTVEVTLNGSDWAEVGGTVAVGNLSSLTGVYKKIRVKQDGGTNSAAIVSHTNQD